MSDGGAELALALGGISKRFGTTTALRDVSVAVRPGTVHALLGENGAGKSTLMRIAYGLLRPDAGTVTVYGVAWQFRSPADAIAAGVGMVHQHFTLVPAMSVAENLALGGRGRYVRREAEARVAALAASTGFALDPEARVETLGVGAQQRVEIAKALVHRARVLILDEPTGVLAPAEVDDLLQWLRRYADAGNAAVLITHKLHEALRVADDVTVLRQGVATLQGVARGMTRETLARAMLGAGTGVVETSAAAVARGVSDAATPTVGDVVFRARGVTVADADGVARVRDASFEIRAGELVGVAAVEGSGQHELLRALAGRLPVRAGALERPALVGFVPEDRHRDAVLLARSLAENVALRGAGARRGRVPWATMHGRTTAMLAAFDVRAEGSRTRMRALSGGNQQKLVLAR